VGAALAYAYDFWEEEDLPSESEQDEQEPRYDEDRIVDAEITNWRQNSATIYQTSQAVSWSNSFNYEYEQRLDIFLTQVQPSRFLAQRSSIDWGKYFNYQTIGGLGIVACITLLIMVNPLSWVATKPDTTNQIFVDVGQYSVSSAQVRLAEGSQTFVASNQTGNSVLGAPSISPDNIDRVLSRYNSPAVGIGRAMYDLGLKYGIDPAYALAFFIKESSAGTAGVAVNTKSIGNIRCTPGYECYYTQGNGSFRKYSTWEAGAEDWFKLIKDLYIGKWGLTTPEKILPVYAPAADRNNPTAYASSVNRLVSEWRSGRF
jgi:hypothetical protein